MQSTTPFLYSRRFNVILIEDWSASASSLSTCVPIDCRHAGQERLAPGGRAEPRRRHVIHEIRAVLGGYASTPSMQPTGLPIQPSAPRQRNRGYTTHADAPNSSPGLHVLPLQTFLKSL